MWPFAQKKLEKYSDPSAIARETRQVIEEVHKLYGASKDLAKEIINDAQSAFNFFEEMFRGPLDGLPQAAIDTIGQELQLMIKDSIVHTAARDAYSDRKAPLSLRKYARSVMEEDGGTADQIAKGYQRLKQAISDGIASLPHKTLKNQAILEQIMTKFQAEAQRMFDRWTEPHDVIRVPIHILSQKLIIDMFAEGKSLLEVTRFLKESGIPLHAAASIAVQVQQEAIIAELESLSPEQETSSDTNTMDDIAFTQSQHEIG